MITAPSLSFSRGLHLRTDHLHRPSSPAPFVPRAASIPMAVASVTTAPSLYEMLEVRSAASGQEIKTAYRRLARACHPDVVAVDRKDMSADRFMRIHAAYETLSDPEKRADYDLSLMKATNRRFTYRSTSFSSSSPRGSSSFSGFTTRRYWETDQCW